VNSYPLKEVMQKTALCLFRSDVKAEVAGLAENMHRVETVETPCLVLSVFTLNAGLCLSEDKLATRSRNNQNNSQICKSVHCVGYFHHV
jgi:hypothetical protein